MVPLFVKESYPSSISNADISFAFIYLPWKENTIFPPSFSSHLYSSTWDKIERKPQASLASSC